MKLEEINLKITEDEYRGSGRAGYSILSTLDKDGPEGLFKAKESTVAMDFGKVVDMMRTDPKGLESQVYLKPIEKFTATTDELYKAVVKNFDNITEFDIYSEDTQEFIKEVARAINAWNKSKEETWNTKVLNESLLEALQQTWEAQGKTHLSQDEWNLANLVVDTLKTHKYTKEYFEANEDEELIFQFTLQYELDGVEMQSRLDMVKVNHKTKVIEPVDLKTGFPKISEFSSNYFKYRYYIQEGLYYTSLYNLMKQYPEFQDYKVEDFKFVYISKQQPTHPLVFKGIGVDKCIGGFRNTSGKWNKGVKELLKDYKYWTSTDELIYTKEMIKNNGVISVNTDYIQ